MAEWFPTFFRLCRWCDRQRYGVSVVLYFSGLAFLLLIPLGAIASILLKVPGDMFLSAALATVMGALALMGLSSLFTPMSRWHGTPAVVHRFCVVVGAGVIGLVLIAITGGLVYACWPPRELVRALVIGPDLAIFLFALYYVPLAIRVTWRQYRETEKRESARKVEAGLQGPEMAEESNPPTRIRRVLRQVPNPEETPEKFFERVHRGFFWTGLMPILIVIVLIVANFVAPFHGGIGLDPKPFLIILGVLILPGVLLMWVGTAMKRARPWSRKAAAGITVAGVLAIAAAFIGTWIVVSEVVLSLLHFTQSYPGAGPLPVGLPSILLFFVLAIPVVGMSAAVFVAGARLFRVYEYLVSDEAKRFFGEAGPETKSAP